jgi:hypothetical protein
MLWLLLLIVVMLGLAAVYVLPPAFRDTAGPVPAPPAPPVSPGGDERE